jgi:hypothetical protein
LLLQTAGNSIELRYSEPAQGRGREVGLSAGLSIPFCIRVGFFLGKNAFGKYATDAIQ